MADWELQISILLGIYYNAGRAKHVLIQYVWLKNALGFSAPKYAIKYKITYTEFNSNQIKYLKSLFNANLRFNRFENNINVGQAFNAISINLIDYYSPIS